MIAWTIITVQSALSIYIWFLLIRNKEKPFYIVSYLWIFIFFVALKFEIVKFEPWTTLDYLVWGAYNSLVYIFFIFYINEKNNGRNITYNNKI